MSRSSKIIAALSLLALVSIVILNALSSSTVKIGLIADLSSRKANLGDAVRNGVILAIDELNKQGGINGLKVELIVRDGELNEKITQQKTSNLVDSGVNLIIGPVHSAMANSVIEAAKQKNVLVISPTVSTDNLSEIHDNFIQINTKSSIQGRGLAEVSKFSGDEKVLLVIDQDNSEHTYSVAQGFKEKSKELGLNILGEIAFVKDYDISDLVDKILRYKTDAIVFITNGKDAARIIQSYNKIGKLPNLYGDIWAKWTNVKEFGGKTVNGMILVGINKNKQSSEKEQNFASSYKQLFGSEYSMPAVYAYEAVKLYAQGVERGSSFDSDDIKKHILGIDQIDGVVDNYNLDKYGDAIRDFSYFEIKDNKYEKINFSKVLSSKLDDDSE